MSDWAAGFAKDRAQRTQADKISLTATIVCDLEDLVVMRRQFLDFMKMRNEAGIETDMEIEMLLDCNKKCRDKMKNNRKMENVQISEEDNRLHGTITSVSEDKHVGFVNDKLFVWKSSQK